MGGTVNLFPEVILGVIAAAFSLPIIGMTVLFATRRSLRVEWRKSKPETRTVIIAYLGIEVGGVIILWSIFLFVILHR